MSSHELQVDLPLVDSTNESRNSRRMQSNKLRRIQSSRLLYRHMDSSDSVPSFHESIWDADLALSNDSVALSNDSGGREVEISEEILPTTPIFRCSTFPLTSTQMHHDNVTATQTFSRKVVSPEPICSVPGGTTGSFHPTHLEPIAEQRSIASLHPASSRGRVGESPERSVTVVRQQQSYHSLHPARRLRGPNAVLKVGLDCFPIRRRAFSFDDLDCSALSSLHCSMIKTHLSASSSSDLGAFANVVEEGVLAAAPRQPPRLPPVRSATPPGVPSFGSPEAISYFNRPPARSSSWWRSGRSPHRRPVATHTSAAAAALSSNLDTPTITRLHPEQLTRRFSLFSNRTSYSTTSAPRRASMPAGALRAEDGTWVRGRFSSRVSGHGISSRGLDSHPLQRGITPSREVKDTEVAGRPAIPTRRESLQRQGHQDATTSVVGTVDASGDNPHRANSFSSLVTIWLSLNRERSAQQPEEREMQERSRSAQIDLAADREEIFGPSRIAPPSRNSNDNTTTNSNSNNPPSGPAPTPACAPAASAPAHKHSYIRRVWRLFCINCCALSQRQLDGEGWSGADRPWTSKGERYDSIKRRQQEEREVRRADWDRANLYRREMTAVAAEAVAEAEAAAAAAAAAAAVAGDGVAGYRCGEREMRFRPGGSLG